MEGFVSKEHQELARSAMESVDASSVSPSQISPSSSSSLKSSSPNGNGNGKLPPISTQQNSHDKEAPSYMDGHPNKGGSDDALYNDPKDPNYDSTEEQEVQITPSKFDDYKRKATIIVEEYFATSDVVSTANELRELRMPSFSYYFVKKLVSMAMDRHDKEKEMAAVLLSTLYAEVVEPSQVYKGFSKLVESADDLIVDIPDTVDVLALFIARAVVDDILPPVFLRKQLACLPADSKGVDVLRRAEKGYLAAPLHSEIIERRWESSMNKTVDDVKVKINNLLVEYVASGDKNEACRCIKELKVPFFHHEIVKRALVMAMERQPVEGQLLDLLKKATEVGLINSSQVTKGFGRIIDVVDDLSLDIPNARGILKSLISKAASEGWLSASSLKSLSLPSPKGPVEDGTVKIFKLKAQSIIQEYFLSGDIAEVSDCIESENSCCSPQLNAMFIKRLVTLAMDRKNREKEMASVLLSSLCFPTDDVVHGFIMLIESADDTVLDIPIVVEDLGMFLARAVVDEVIAPQQLEEIGNQFLGTDSTGNKVLQMAKSLLKARLSGERILRCWGGGGSSKNGWAVEDIKDKIGKLLEEFESGGDVREACRCIKELGMPFFHHEVVKKALVKIMESKMEKLWGLLNECFRSGLITTYQMTKGFGRVAESLEDLRLDVPDAEKQFGLYVEKAKLAGWLDSSFGLTKASYGKENGINV
ncbi:MA3 DOMAIN-CONTAINING TRANSLATION REGULATORY FACTOR 2 [Linum grandiflorum]